MRIVLVAAGVYNIAWGLWAGLFPSMGFRLAGMEPPNYLFLWQCIGMIVGVYGIGYLAASRAPMRHWPIVLVGLLGKTFGPIGFAQAYWQGMVTPAFGVNLIFNDLIWWVPFAMILWHAARFHQAPPPADVPPPDEAMRAFRVHAGSRDGASLAELSMTTPVLVVFLRHLGCTFCREAVADLAATRQRLEREGTTLVLVHMSPPGEGAAFFERAGLAGVPHISDPGAVLYRSFGLARGSFWQLFGPPVWIQGAKAFLKGHGVGKLAGDGFQMPGVFLIRQARIVRRFVHRAAGDRPDYADLASCPIEPQGAAAG